MTEIMCNANINALAEVQAKIKALQAQAAELEDGIRQYMAEQSLGKMVTLQGHQALMTPYSASRFDKKAMIAKYGKAEYDSFCKPCPAVRFSVT